MSPQRLLHVFFTNYEIEWCGNAIMLWKCSCLSKFVLFRSYCLTMFDFSKDFRLDQNQCDCGGCSKVQYKWCRHSIKHRFLLKYLNIVKGGYFQFFPYQMQLRRKSKGTMKNVWHHNTISFLSFFPHFSSIQTNFFFCDPVTLIHHQMTNQHNFSIFPIISNVNVRKYDKRKAKKKGQKNWGNNWNTLIFLRFHFVCV